MRIVMLGTRGVPACYGGFETAVEEIGKRLVEAGHEVTVYCRGAADTSIKSYLGMELVHLPAARRKSLETLSHTALSVAHLLMRRKRPDAVIMFNAANSPFVPLLRMRSIPVAVHVDGLEWKRAKWKGAGRRYYRIAEALAVRWADALIADAQGIADYYDDEFGASTTLITYGAPIQSEAGQERISDHAVEPKKYHLVVARFEPENHVEEIVAGYHASTASCPLLVVGSAPYSDDYTARITAIAAEDERIHLVGGVWDQEELDELYANALTYLHGHSVGGTNPSLLRAMGAGTAVLAWDVTFNREVLGEDGEFFDDLATLGGLLDKAESDPGRSAAVGSRLRDRAADQYRWSDVTDKYAALAGRLCRGESIRTTASGRRRRRAQADHDTN